MKNIKNEKHNNLVFLDRFKPYYQTAEELAEAVQISPRTVYNWRQGRPIPKLARYGLECHLRELKDAVKKSKAKAKA